MTENLEALRDQLIAANRAAARRALATVRRIPVQVFEAPWMIDLGINCFIDADSDRRWDVAAILFTVQHKRVWEVK